MRYPDTLSKNKEIDEVSKNLNALASKIHSNRAKAIPKFVKQLEKTLANLEMPAVKFKIDGGHGGHNGLRSIDSHIGRDYIRVRVGIGKPENKSQVANWVLSNFSKEEIKLLDSIITHVIKSLTAIQNSTLEEVKSQYTLKVNI